MEKFEAAGMALSKPETHALRRIMRGYHHAHKAGLVSIVPGWYHGDYIGVFTRRDHGQQSGQE